MADEGRRAAAGRRRQQHGQDSRWRRASRSLRASAPAAHGVSTRGSSHFEAATAMHRQRLQAPDRHRHQHSTAQHSMAWHTISQLTHCICTAGSSATSCRAGPPMPACLHLVHCSFPMRNAAPPTRHMPDDHRHGPQHRHFPLQHRYSSLFSIATSSSTAMLLPCPASLDVTCSPLQSAPPHPY